MDPVTVRLSAQSRSCVWCDQPLLNKNQVVFCTNECNAQYIIRALPEELRKAVRQRDAGICEWCGRDDMHYALVNKVSAANGGGACGVDEMITLCSGCVDGFNPYTPAEWQDPKIPDMTTRKVWSSHKSPPQYRFLIAPVLYSHTKWARAVTAFKQERRFGVLASQRSHDHGRMCQLSLRWWKFRGRSRLRDKTIGELINDTIFDLESQLRGTALWIAHLRQQNLGYLD